MDTRPDARRVEIPENKFEQAVFICRIQGLTDAHMDIIKRASLIAKRTNVLIGSVHRPRDSRNSFSFEERKLVLEDACHDAGIEVPRILPVRDIPYNNAAWMKQVQEAVGDSSKNTCLIGHSKDNTSFYMKLFRQWSSHDMPGMSRDGGLVSATAIRESYFSEDNLKLASGNVTDDIAELMVGPTIRALAPKATVDFLLNFAKRKAYLNVAMEMQFKRNHDDMWRVKKKFDRHLVNEKTRLIREAAAAGNDITAMLEDLIKTVDGFSGVPYPVIFTTVDSVVIQGDSILMIERKNYPGKGLLALPGGYLNPDEDIELGSTRELKEETRIKLPVRTLLNNLKFTQHFANPHRSTRGRIITFANLIDVSNEVGGRELIRPGEPIGNTKVRAASDAKNVFWKPLKDIKSEDCFEDHYDIIQSMTARYGL